MNPPKDDLIPNQPLSLPEKYSHLAPKEYVQALMDFIEKHRQWTAIHIVDFITLNQWEILPEDWRQTLLPKDESINEEEWIDSIIKITAGSDNEQWPESLRAFIRDTRDISLSRVVTSTESNQVTCELNKRIMAGMVEKKIHEVERMTPVVQKIAKDHNVKSIVDLGAGQGYLSRSLAFKSQLKVLAVDSSEIQTCGAKKFDKKVVKSLGEDVLNLHHVTDFITPDNASSILSKWSNIDENEDERPNEKWLLCGLHTCGDLATMMLRLYTSSPEISCFVDVGCCYHFLTEEDGTNGTEENIKNSGFPVSDYVRKAGLKLGSTAKMLSCQAPARWIDQQNETLEAYEHHFFRALLQLMMVEKGLTDVSVAPVVGRLNKKKDFVSFPVYVKAALKRLKMSENTFSIEEVENYYNEYKARKVDKQIIIIWTLRVLLAPVLESLILMDRWLYLDSTIEDSPTKSISLWPLFDPVMSPRNMVLVAIK
ncbi:MAG: methyltransferase domain-containing protein [Benjaminiella poitrasii]|nr:MAG: methyltransferase domain-containing protein [Benjaminiella poitrasii]